MDERRIQDYVAGRMPAAQAEEFEAQMFADDELAAEVERALEIRAASQDAAALPVGGESRRRVAVRPIWAIAASAAALAIGLSWYRLQIPPEPVFRGAEQRMGLRVEVTGDQLSAHWTPIAGATAYELKILAADGSFSHSQEVATTSLVLDLHGVEPAVSETPPAFVEVAALDEFGQTIMRSERVSLSRSDEPAR